MSVCSGLLAAAVFDPERTLLNPSDSGLLAVLSLMQCRYPARPDLRKTPIISGTKLRTKDAIQRSFSTKLRNSVDDLSVGDIDCVKVKGSHVVTIRVRKNLG